MYKLLTILAMNRSAGNGWLTLELFSKTGILRALIAPAKIVVM